MFSYEMFKPAEGSVFQISGSAGPVLEARLVMVAQGEARKRPADMRLPFKLHFKGTRGVHLEQNNYRFTHPELGELIFFIVPIAHDAQTQEYTYEAIFN